MLNSLACHGCSDDFDPASRVVNLRILAVQADKPFAQPGEEVTLTALYHDPEARALSWAFGPCESAASSSALACAQSLAFSSLTLGDAPSHTFQVPSRAEGASFLAGNALGMVVVACPGTLAGGTTSGIPLRCLDHDGNALGLNEFELGIKRIFVHEERIHRNPQIEMILWNGERWPEGEEREARCENDGKKCKKVVLELRARDSEERATDAEGQPVVEHKVVQFYATGGTFEDDVRAIEEPDTTWRPRLEDRGERLTMWIVLRDDRGGVSWSERHVRVR